MDDTMPECCKGLVPNAETQAAIRDGRAGKVETFATFDAMMADLENDDED